MIFTEFTKKALAVRREARDLTKQGYRCHETDWEIVRGARQDERIVDAVISVCGKYVYTKLGTCRHYWRPITKTVTKDSETLVMQCMHCREEKTRVFSFDAVRRAG